MKNKREIMWSEGCSTLKIGQMRARVLYTMVELCGTGIQEGLVECGSATSNHINASLARSPVKLGRLLTTQAIRRTCSGPPRECTLQRYV